MADRYWVGGTASWDGTAGTKWATTSGGAGGASVPTSADNVFFTAASGTVTVTVSATANCANLNFTGFTGTLAGTSSILIYGSVVIVAGMTITHTGTLYFSATSGSYTLTTNGKSIPSRIIFGFNASTSTWTLQDALTNTNNNGIAVDYGTFTTNNYNVTAVSLVSSNSNTRAINLGSSTLTLSATVAVNFGVAGAAANLAFNAGTSSIVASGTSGYFSGGSKDFYNLSYTSTAGSTFGLEAVNSANNITVAGRASAGVTQLSILGDTTVNGTLTFSAGTNATCRTFVRASSIGTTRTLTCAAVASLTDIDFRDITIAGAAAPVSGTRLGDCKGNSGITFGAAKTVYFRNTSGNWGLASAGGSWSFTNGGTADQAAFPLAQDTAIFPSSPTPYPSSGTSASLNDNYNIGTIDMSARTSNTMTLATSTSAFSIYGNWINGTGTTITGTGSATYTGRGTQTITSAGKTFTFSTFIDTPGGSVTLQDAFVINRSTTGALLVNKGTFDANNYNVSLTGAASSFSSSNSNVRTIAIGSGTWTIAGSGGWTTSTSTNLTLTGTGTISMTSASAKQFTGGSVLTFPTINQGGTGTLTITGSNKFAGITDTAIGRVQFTGGTTNEFTAFSLGGVSGNLLALGSTNTTQVTLKKPTAWNVGANSTDGGNNTGLSFTAGGNDYLNISYVIGEVTTPPSVTYAGSFFAFF
jgi:hypothetical protein